MQHKSSEPMSEIFLVSTSCNYRNSVNVSCACLITSCPESRGLRSLDEAPNCTLFQREVGDEGDGLSDFGDRVELVCV